MEVLKSYRVKIGVLSPLHIGSGGRWLRDFDFAIAQEHVYLLDIDRILDSLPSEQLKQWQGQPPARLIPESRWPEFSREVLLLKGQRGAVPGEFLSFVRDSEGRIYLPGSSLKGSLRTILLYHLSQTNLTRPIPAGLLTPSGKLDRRYAARPIERKLLRPALERGSDRGSEANYDLLRCIHIGDGFLKEGRTGIYQVFWVGPRRSRHLTWAECLTPGAVFEADLTLDLHLINDSQARRCLGVPRGWEEPAFFIGAARSRAKELLEREERFFAGVGETAAVALCTRLLSRLNSLSENAFLLPLGWGTGWPSKTLDDLLSDQALRTWGVTRPRGRRLAGPPGARLPLGWVEVHIGGKDG